MTKRPVVFFACVHKSGRSVAAAALARHYAGDAIDVRDAGSNPSNDVNPVVAKALAGAGLPVVGHTPTRLDYDLVNDADVVITLGCNEACPAIPGKRAIDWHVADAKGKDAHSVNEILADLDSRVRALLIESTPDLQLPPSVFL